MPISCNFFLQLPKYFSYLKVMATLTLDALRPANKSNGGPASFGTLGYFSNTQGKLQKKK